MELLALLTRRRRVVTIVSMIEDALKSCRTVHRALIAASAVILVFASSLSSHSNLSSQRTAISKLLEIDFSQYDDFVLDAAKASINDYTDEKMIHEFESSLAEMDVPIENYSDLVSILREPWHIGRLAISATPLVDMNRASIEDISSLLQRQLNRDATVVVVDPSLGQRLVSELIVSAPSRVTDIDRYPDADVPPIETWLTRAKAEALIYSFALPSTSGPPTPYVQGEIGGKVHLIEGTSFLDWVATRLDVASAFNLSEGQISLPSALQSMGYEKTRVSLGALAETISQEIFDAGPDSQSATFLGATIPGKLMLLTAPVILLLLSYWLTAHLAHLRNIVSTDPTAFVQFAWIPLMTGRRPKWVWRADFMITTTVLPIAALCVLAIRLSAFGLVRSYVGLAYAVCSLILFILAVVGVASLTLMRAELVSSQSVVPDE